MKIIKKIYYFLLLFLRARGILPDKFQVYRADSKRDYDDIFGLRYKVYCLEKKYLDSKKYPTKKERDIYDDNSILFIARSKNGKIAGTFRLIMRTEQGVQAEEYVALPRSINKNKVAELSRFVVAAEHRHHGHELTFQMMRETVKYCLDNNIDYLVAVTFFPNWKIFNRLRMPFLVFGEPQKWLPMPGHYVVPTILDVKKTLAYIKILNKTFFRYFLKSYKNVIVINNASKKLFCDTREKINLDWEKYKNFI